jgi:hypothetical protein
MSQNSEDIPRGQLADGSFFRYGTLAANQDDFNAVPLMHAIDELGFHILDTAGTNQPDSSLCTMCMNDEELLSWLFRAIGIPPGVRNPLEAIQGFLSSLTTLASDLTALKPLCSGLQKLRPSLTLQFADKIYQLKPLAGRKRKYPAFNCALQLHASKAGGDELHKLKCIFATELLWCWLKGKTPGIQVLGRVIEQTQWLSNKTSKNAPRTNGWSDKAQRACMDLQLAKLANACKSNPTAAASLGLRTSLIPSPISDSDADPIKSFNRDYRARLTASTDHTPVRVRQGANSAHNLSVNLCRMVGLMIRAGIESHDRASLSSFFQSLFNISAQLAAQVEITDDLENSKSYLAISINRGMARLNLEWLLEESRVPDPITTALYEKTSRSYFVVFPPFVTRELQTLNSPGHEPPVTALGVLIGDLQFHPKADILGGTSKIRCTVHKFRQELACEMLQDGTPRMITALDLSQFGFVSAGRPFYGMARGEQLHKALQDLYRKIGWLGAREKLPLINQLIGSLAVPTKAAVTQVFEILSRRADNAAEEHNAESSLLTWNELNQAVMAYFAAVLEFTLCLRESIGYKINRLELESPELMIHLNDKNVHALGGGHGNCKPAFLINLTPALIEYFETAVNDPVLSQSAAGKRIHDCIEAALRPGSRANLLLNFDIDGNQLEVGTATWHQVLPTSMRLVENFGRQFWPCYVHDAGLSQRHLDYLLRHVLQAWEHNTSHDPVPSVRVRSQLFDAINQVIDSLSLSVPKLLVRVGDGA